VILSGTTPTDFDAKGSVSNVRTKSLGVASQSTYSSKQALTYSVLVNVGATNSLTAFPEWGSAYFSAPVCGITSTGELWCANAVDAAAVGSLQANFQYDFSYNGGPVTCYDSTRVTTQSCTNTTSGTKYSLTNLSDSTSGIFKGKVLSSVYMYGGFGSGSTYRQPHICVTTTDGQVLCADTVSSGSVNTSMGGAGIPEISFSGGVTTCYDATRVTTLSCTSTAGTIKYWVTNLSDSTSGLFRGKAIYSNPANNAYTYTTTYLY